MKIEYRGLTFEFHTPPSPEDLQQRYDEKIAAMRLASEAKRHTLRKHEYGDEAPLASGQTRLWFLQKLEPENVAYLQPRVLRLHGDLDVELLRSALLNLITRHEVLRTVLPEREGLPYQKILPAADAMAWSVRDLSDADDPAEAAERAIRKLCHAPFDLASDAPLKTTLFRLSPTEHILLLLFHHVGMDVWSDQIVRAEVFGFYDAASRGETFEPGELPIQYADYAIWEESQLEEKGAASREFWMDYLHDASMSVEWPFGEQSAERSGRPAGTIRFQWSRELSERLEELAGQADTTLFVTLFAAYMAFLVRTTGQRDLVVGTPVTMRRTIELQRLVGFFPNLVPIRGRVSPDVSFHEWLAQFQSAWAGTLDHQWLPFQEMVGREHRGGPTLSTDTAFTYQHDLDEATATATLGDLSLEFADRDQPEAVFGVELQMSSVGGRLGGFFRYDAGRFDEKTTRALSDRFERFVERCLKSPDRAISNHDLLSEQERRSVGSTWACGPAPDLSDEPVHALFEHVAARRPDAIALECGREIVSYAELDQRANQLAHYLRGLGVRAETMVALSVERSVDAIVCILGILKAGGVYVPLDPAYPTARLGFMLEDTEASVLITHRGLGEHLPPNSATLVRLEDAEGDIASCPTEALPPGCATDNLAYVMYTSGSTGRPKGVAVPHGSIPRLMIDAEYARFGPDQTLLLYAPLSFDASTFEIWGALLNGSKLVIPPPQAASLNDLGVLIREKRVTMMFITTGLFHVFADEQLGALTGMQQVIAGGDVLSRTHVQRVIENMPDGHRFIAAYGPTESTTFTTCYPMESADSLGDLVPIGQPISHTQVYILDQFLNLVASQTRGELYIGGQGLARAYHRRPAQTALRFVPDPFGACRGGRVYRTGDLARWRTDGVLDFQGRVDQQVKVQGFRIEPAEIEARLDEHPAVAQSLVAIERGTASGDERLVAYICAESEGRAPSPEDLETYLHGLLPAYMVPRQFMVLDTFPLGPTGKVDREALPSSTVLRQQSTKRFAPTTETQFAIAEAWKKHMQLDEIGIHENFFEVGGHSLIAVRVQHELVANFGLEIPLARLMEHPTVAELAAWIDAGGQGESSAPIERHDYGDEAPVSSDQRRMWFLQKLHPDSVAYQVPVAVRLQGALDEAALRAALEALVERHEVLRTVYPERDGEPIQKILPDATVTWRFEDLRVEDDAEDVARERVDAEIATPFDLENEVSLRTTLLRVGESDHVALLLFHHIAIDEWTTGVLLSELSELYTAVVQNREPQVPELPLQYADYAIWQREQLTGDAFEHSQQFWREQLNGAVRHIDWPMGEEPATDQRPAATLKFAWDATTTATLHEAARAHGMTDFGALYAAFSAFLCRLTGQRDLTIGLPVTMRQRPELQSLVGFLLNTVPMRSRLLGDVSFEGHLRQTRQDWQETMTHQWVPLEEIVRASGAGRSGAMFDTMFTFVPASGGEARFGNLDLDGLEIETLPEAKATLVVHMSERDGQFVGAFEYDAARFDRGSVERVLSSFEKFVQQCLRAPDDPIFAHDLIDRQTDETIARWSRGPAMPVPDEPVHRLFETQVSKNPERVALSWEAGTWTYSQLDRRANALAHKLIRRGVRPGVAVGVSVDRSPQLVMALLGVLKAGAHYVALAPELPPERLTYIAGDAGAEIVVVDERGRQALSGQSGLEFIPTDEVGEAASGPDVSTDCDDLIYVLYTSGSTGQPKGVMLRHGSVANHVEWLRSACDVTGDDVFLLKSEVGFDMSVSELFGPLALGATMAIAKPEGQRDPRYLVDAVQKFGVTCLRVVPTALTLMLNESGIEQCAATLKWVMLGGEALGPATRDRFFDVLPGVELHNPFGITETCVDVTYWKCPTSSRGGPVSIGGPMGNYHVNVLDHTLSPVPAQILGELCVGGPGVAFGYAGLAAKTALSFVPDPFRVEPGARMYRSGDVAAWNEDGTLDYRGRLDDQLQVRGVRIELGEVEAQLEAAPGVLQVAVRGIGVESGRADSLVAYLVFEPGAEPTSTELREHLARHLSDAVIPSQFVRLEAMPRTPSGKIDRKALQEPTELLRSQERIMPRNETEQAIARVWKQHLDLDEIGVHENFFEIGGHSLLAVRIQADMRTKFSMEFPLAELLANPTIAQVANLIIEKEAEHVSDEELDDILAGFLDEH